MWTNDGTRAQQTQRHIVDSDSSYKILKNCHEAKGYPYSLQLWRSELGKRKKQNNKQTNKTTKNKQEVTARQVLIQYI